VTKSEFSRKTCEQKCTFWEQKWNKSFYNRHLYQRT